MPQAVPTSLAHQSHTTLTSAPKLAFLFLCLQLQVPHLPFYLPSHEVQLQYRTTLLLNHRPGTVEQEKVAFNFYSLMVVLPVTLKTKGFSVSFSLIRLVLNHYGEEQELGSHLRS